MIPELNKTAVAMEKLSHHVHYYPVNVVSIEERYRTIEGLLTRLWRVAHRLNIDIGRIPTIIHRTSGTIDSVEALEDLAQLHVAILMTYHVLGLGACEPQATLEILDHIINKHEPKIKDIVTTILEGPEHHSHV